MVEPEEGRIDGHGPSVISRPEDGQEDSRCHQAESHCQSLEQDARGEVSGPAG